MVTWRERDVRNEARFRDQNEWIDATSESFGARRMTVFVCECDDSTCARTIEMTKAEYECVRSVSSRFAVAPNHENPESEAVISECSRFAVIHKIEGLGLRIARETDPRADLTARPRRRT
jgi:hypothetical protein